MTVNAHAERTAPILASGAIARNRTLSLHRSAECTDRGRRHRPATSRGPAARDRAGADKAALSSRDFYFLYTDGIDACAGCHERIINPMFGMEDFDNVGRRRPTAGNDEVTETIGGRQTTVSLAGTLFGVASTSDSAVIEYSGAKDLSNRIANTNAVTACLARKSFRFLTGATYLDRDLDLNHQESLTPEQRNANTCAASRMLEAFETNGQSPRAMFIELATDSLLLFRR